MPGSYLSYPRDGGLKDYIKLFDVGDRFDWSRGWIHLGREPTVHSVCLNLVQTYLHSVGRSHDGPYSATIMSGMEQAAAVEMSISNPNAFLFEDKDGWLDLAVYLGGYYWDSQNAEVKTNRVGVPIRLWSKA